MKKVFVSGCYDLLHSGHVEFFRQAAQYGDLYVGIGSDKTILAYKNHKTLFPEEERLFMVKSIRYVKDAFINDGDGVMDFVGTVDRLKPDVFVVNADGASEAKREFCRERGIEYVVLEREPHEGLAARSSTALKEELELDGPAESLTGTKSWTNTESWTNAGGLDLSKFSQKSWTGTGSPQMSKIPTRLDLAGTWIDQPYVSMYAPGWALTVSLEPTFEVRERCGLSTSTRNLIKKIWPYQLPNMDPEILARLVFCFENDPERRDGYLSGAQDAIGICVPGLCRHWYDNGYWPLKIERCDDPAVLDWLEEHLCMVPMEPRAEGCSVVDGKDINEAKVKALAAAAEACWKAILSLDLKAFASAYKASFNAQVAMFPAMVQGNVGKHIEHYSAEDGVLAWKMPGAGGGGYLALVVRDSFTFCSEHPETIQLKIRRA
ncbi:MAG: adenylyltransferase/cytidyltransferase family protein [Bacteroidales bacterium]|nr:adenylyltransferase/cytidyltransferase family protein [Bacteroidales bacterium]